jgi:hypothetical protein
MIVRGAQHGIGQGAPFRDNVVQSDVWMQAQRPREHWPGQVSVDEDGSPGSARQCPGQSQDQGRSSLRPMAAREKEDPNILKIPRFEQAVGH